MAVPGRLLDVCIFGDLRLWSGRGLIHIEDSRDNRYESCSIRTALRRLIAISNMLRNGCALIPTSGAMPFEEFDRHIQLLEKMEEICRKA